MTNGSQAYLKTKVLTASPAELRLMLIDGAIRFSEQARRASYKTATYIRHDPIKSVLIAAAVGAGAMALYGLLRQDHGANRR